MNGLNFISAGAHPNARQNPADGGSESHELHLDAATGDDRTRQTSRSERNAGNGAQRESATGLISTPPRTPRVSLASGASVRVTFGGGVAAGCTDAKEKWCPRCDVVKPVSEFNKRTASRDGLQKECRGCQSDRERVYVASGRGFGIRREAERRKYVLRKQDCPEKLRARYILRNAVKSGRVQKSPCATCANPNVEAHHEDYSRPLEVTWYCRRHHADHHSRERAV